MFDEHQSANLFKKEIESKLFCLAACKPVHIPPYAVARLLNLFVPYRLPIRCRVGTTVGLKVLTGSPARL